MATETDTALALRVSEAIEIDADDRFAANFGQDRVMEWFHICRITFSEARTLARILREYAEGGWRPIEIAPKDGTVVLLYCPHGDGTPGNTYRVTAGNWESDPGGTTEYRDREGRWIDQDDRDGWKGWISLDGGFSEDTMMPTHWRPLPSPPQEQSK